MEFFDGFRSVKVDLKDILAIIVSLITIIGALSEKVRKIVKWIWSKTMGPIIDRLTGREKTNRLINSLIESNNNFQNNHIDAIHQLSLSVENLQVQHQNIFNEVRSIKSEIETNGGSTLKDGSNLTNALLWTMINDKEDAAVLQTDNNGQVIKSNRYFRSLTGKSASEIVGTGWINCIAEKDRNRVWKEFNEAISEKRDYEGSYSLVNDNGEEIMVRSRATRLTDQKGNIIGYLRTIKLTEY